MNFLKYQNANSMNLSPRVFISLLLIIYWLAGCKSPALVTTSQNKSPVPEQINVPRAELEGQWDFTMTNLEGAITGTLAIRKGGAVGYSGWIKVKELNLEAETIISRAEMKGNAFVYNGEVKTSQGNYPFELTGTINQNQLTGLGKLTMPQGLTTYKVAANRR